MFTVAASLSVHFFTIVTRKAYGLGAALYLPYISYISLYLPYSSHPVGAMAMAGGMSVGGASSTCRGPLLRRGRWVSRAVELGFEGARRGGAHLPAEARRQLYTSLVEAAHERGGALSVARTLETDEVIDPAESRAWIQAALEASPAPPRERGAHRGKRRPCVSPW